MRISYRCMNCDGVSSADRINEVTINECCNNRSDRRKYTPIEKTSPKDRKWYRCPLCGIDSYRKGFVEE